MSNHFPEFYIGATQHIYIYIYEPQAKVFRNIPVLILGVTVAEVRTKCTPQFKVTRAVCSKLYEFRAQGLRFRT